MSTVRRVLKLSVAGLFAASGALHLARPEAFAEFLPELVPAPRAVNAVAGVVEIVCAYGLVTHRAWAGRASAATLLAVWPSNLEFAIRASREHGASSRKALLGWARMPLQVPMIWAVLED
jgi:uncharacterized membrane protein